MDNVLDELAQYIMCVEKLMDFLVEQDVKLPSEVSEPLKTADVKLAKALSDFFTDEY